MTVDRMSHGDNDLQSQLCIFGCYCLTGVPIVVVNASHLRRKWRPLARRRAVLDADWLSCEGAGACCCLLPWLQLWLNSGTDVILWSYVEGPDKE